MKTLLISVGLAVAVGVSTPAEARITKIEVVTVESPTFEGVSFGTVGPYQKLRWRVFGEVDPKDARNALIVDLVSAPRNAKGMVEYSTDVFILKPITLARGNRRLFLYHINNRGNIGVLGAFNDGGGGNNPSSAAHAGNGFLMRHGYTVVSSGWEPGVKPGGNRLTISVPVAAKKNPDGSSLVGPSLEEFVVDEAATIAGSLSYSAATLDK